MNHLWREKKKALQPFQITLVSEKMERADTRNLSSRTSACLYSGTFQKKLIIQLESYCLVLTGYSLPIAHQILQHISRIAKHRLRLQYITNTTRNLQHSLKNFPPARQVSSAISSVMPGQSDNSSLTIIVLRLTSASAPLIGLNYETQLDHADDYCSCQ